MSAEKGKDKQEEIREQLEDDKDIDIEEVVLEEISGGQNIGCYPET